MDLTVSWHVRGLFTYQTAAVSLRDSLVNTETDSFDRLYY